MNFDRLNDSTLWVGADTETCGLEAAYAVNCKLHCLTAHINGESRIYTERADIQQILDNYVLCFVNAKFDVAVLRTNGYTVNEFHDIAVANYSLMGARSSTFNSLDGMAGHYLNSAKLPKPNDWSVFDAQAQAYALHDCTLTHELISKVLDALALLTDAWSLYTHVDLQYVNVLIEMYKHGTYVEGNELLPLVPVYESNIADIVNQHTSTYGYKQGKADVIKGADWTTIKGMPAKREIVNGRTVLRFAKCDIEPLTLRGGDRQHVLTTFYPHLADTMPRTANGSLKTDKHTLTLLEPVCPAATMWLEYENRSKQLGTFLLPLIDLANAGNHVIRPSIHNYNTRTGRLSCSTPNIQQVPAHGERGAEVRRAFVAPPGYKVVVGDLDRIEIVVMAFYLKVLLNNTVLEQRLLTGDVHQQNCDAWLCDRDAAKRGVFTVIYGGGANKLATVLKTSTAAAGRILATITNELQLDAYRQAFVEQAVRNDGYFTNYFGRRLYIPELLSRDKQELASGKRKAGNYPIQSTAGDVFKHMQNAASTVRANLGYVNEVAWQSIVVHDEVIYIVREDVVNEFITNVEPCYNRTDIFSGIDVSLKFGVGDNWYEAKKAA
jgi:DNA polymerase I-like protein with 3'-5' exonuclease and polymerase domains